MLRIKDAGKLLGWSGLALAALLSGRVESAGDKQPTATALPPSYAEVFKTARTKLTAIYGTSEQDAANNPIVAFSADGKVSLSTSGGNVSDDGQVGDSTITVWDVESGERLQQIRVKKAHIIALQMTPNGNRAFGVLWLDEQGLREKVGAVRALVVWDLKNGKELKRWADPGQSQSIWIALSPDGKRGLTCGNEVRINVWDLEKATYLQTISADLRSSAYITFSLDGKLAAFIETKDGFTSSIQIWDLTSGKKVHTLACENSFAHYLQFSEDGKQLAVVLVSPLEQTVKIWDTGTGKVTSTLADKDASSGTILLAFSQDGKRLALVNGHRSFNNLGMGMGAMNILGSPTTYSMVLWELRGAKKLWSKPLLRNPSFVAFTADNQQVLVRGVGQSFALLDAADGKELRARGGDHSAAVTGVAISADGKTFYSASSDRTIKRWNFVTGKEDHTVQAHTKDISCLALSADGKRLLSGSADQTVKLWDTASGKLLRTFTGHTERVTGVAFSKDAQFALSGSMDRTARLWEVATGKELRILAGHAEGVTGVALAANGSLAITASEDHTLKIWDLPDGKPQVLKGHQDAVTCVALSADGNYLLSGSKDQTVKLWDVITGRELKTYRGHKNWVTAVSFSPNGKLGVSVSDDLTAKLWDLTSGKEVDQLDLGQCSDCGRCLAFAPDGRSVLIGTANWVVLRVQLTGKTGK